MEYLIEYTTWDCVRFGISGVIILGCILHFTVITTAMTIGCVKTFKAWRQQRKARI